MPKTIPCLWFNGNAEEAAKYYVSVFPSSRVGAIERYPEDNPFPSNFPPGTALTVEFELDGQPYVGLNGGPEFTFSEAISFQIMCQDQEEIDHYWDTLSSDGGEEGPCGWLKDRYGLSWQVVPVDLARWASDPAKSTKVMHAISGMKKLDLAALRQAAGEA
jgi:predicted 3-demethylubiquinone-9 3-methyltransferase (glyoxalase superfamily)